MAHKRKDTYVPGEWAKHLKPEGKRKMAKAERRAIKRVIKKLNDPNFDCEIW